MSLFPDTEDVELQDDGLREEEPIVLKTYNFDFETGEIRGSADTINAIQQFIRKTILTPRYKHIIYSYDYGCEVWGIIGMSDANDAFIRSEIERTIKEALLYDERIQDIINFEFDDDYEFDAIVVKFDVLTIEGLISIKEVIQ